MKRILLFSTLFTGSVFFAKAQMLTPEVVASSGDYFTAPWGSLSWTAGESMVETFSSGSYILTQGFQQPENLSITAVEETHSELSATVYPNPALNFVNLHFSKALSGVTKLELFDVAGNMVQAYTYSAQRENGFSMDLTNVAGGMYLLKVSNAAWTAAQLFKIQKTN